MVTKAFLRRIGLIAIGIMTLGVVVLSLVQSWFIYFAKDPTAYGAVLPNEQGLPPADRRAAFLVLHTNQGTAYPSNIIELLATTEPGVVDTKAGAHIRPANLKAILIQTAIVGEPSEYRVYRVAEAVQDKMKATRQPGGKQLVIEPQDGEWQPGAYLVDVPSEGMFGGRTYYQFYVDP